MRHIRHLAFATLLLVATSPARAEEPLERLRADFAERYLEPSPHMALAKHFHDKGDRLLAFYLLESARRTRFPGDVFDAAFGTTFHPEDHVDSSEAAETALRKRLEADARSFEVTLKLARLYAERGDAERTAPLLRKAIELAPGDYEPVRDLIELLAATGDKDEAAHVHRSYCERNPDSLVAIRSEIESSIEQDREKALTLVAKGLARFPKDPSLHFNNGVLLQNGKDLDGAEKEFALAAQLGKSDAHIQGWTARFYLKVRDDKVRSLEHYLNAYFLDPHFYDSEYAESRINKLASGLGNAKARRLLADGTPPEKLLADPDPVVVGVGMARLSASWDPKHVPLFVTLMAHDHPDVRWQATATLRDKVDASFDGELKELLADKDLRRRGLASYIAMSRWDAKALPLVAPLLKEKAQLLRFDAVSSLLEKGGEAGKKIVLDYRESGAETNPVLKGLLARLE